MGPTVGILGIADSPNGCSCPNHRSGYRRARKVSRLRRLRFPEARKAICILITSHIQAAVLLFRSQERITETLAGKNSQ